MAHATAHAFIQASVVSTVLLIGTELLAGRTFGPAAVLGFLRSRAKGLFTISAAHHMVAPGLGIAAEGMRVVFTMDLANRCGWSWALPLLPLLPRTCTC